MPLSDSRIRSRAGELAEEIATGLREGHALEWVEERLITALLEVARQERAECATAADRRAAMWEASERRMGTGTWPPESRTEARERRKEALVIADALRAGLPEPHG